MSGTRPSELSISSPAVLEALLNGRSDVDGPPWLLPLWASLDERLRCSARRPRLRYVVRAAKSGDSLSGDAPEVLLLRGDGNRVEVSLDPVFFNRVPPHLGFVLDRAFSTTLAVECSLSYREPTEFEHAICLSDVGREGLLSFTGRDTPARLLPDPGYVQSLAYEHFKTVIDRDWIPWERRAREAVWRGQLNGLPTSAVDGIISTPRAFLCAQARRLDHASFVDAKLTEVAPFIDDRYGNELHSIRHLFGEPIPPEQYMRSKYLIDIDGWANAWSGLFRKLLTGSTVIKVASQKGFRQWYYDRLEPWVNYVPVRADLTDLDEAIAFVLENDDRAREIGEAGRRLALSLGLEAEIYGIASVL